MNLDGEDASGIKFSWKEADHSIGHTDIVSALFELGKVVEYSENLQFMAGKNMFAKILHFSVKHFDILRKLLQIECFI